MSLASPVRFLSFSLFLFGFMFATLLGAWCFGGEKTWESKGIFWVCSFFFFGFVNIFWVSGFVNFFFFVCFLRK